MSTPHTMLGRTRICLNMKIQSVTPATRGRGNSDPWWEISPRCAGNNSRWCRGRERYGDGKDLEREAKSLMGHLSRQDHVMMELKHALSGASNNTHRRGPTSPSVPANQTAQRVDNNTPRGEVCFNGAGGTGRISGNDNSNDPFKTEFMRFTGEINEWMD